MAGHRYRRPEPLQAPATPRYTHIYKCIHTCAYTDMQACTHAHIHTCTHSARTHTRKIIYPTIHSYPTFSTLFLLSALCSLLSSLFSLSLPSFFPLSLISLSLSLSLWRIIMPCMILQDEKYNVRWVGVIGVIGVIARAGTELKAGSLQQVHRERLHTHIHTHARVNADVHIHMYILDTFVCI